MLELIALIILILSLGGIILVLVKKIPVLTQMPEVQEGIQKENIISVLRKKIKSISPDKIILLKTLSKTRVFVLKIEKYIDNWLQKMRKKAIAQKQQREEEKKNNPPAGGPSNNNIPPTMPE